MVAETLMEYDGPLVASDGKVYRARACGRDRDDGHWEAWFEFESVDGELVWRTPRETTQPNRRDLMYWATGISSVFLEGALQRAMEPRPHVTVRSPSPPAFEGPAEDIDVDVSATTVPSEPVLDPFADFARGEAFLRRRLGALDAWHLRVIARAHRILSTPTTLDELDKPELIELIVAHVRGVAAPIPPL
jgi:hypothetical protein